MHMRFFDTDSSLSPSLMAAPRPRTTALQPFVSPTVPGGTTALLYPQDDSHARLVSWPVDTLAQAAGTEGSLPYFDYNPVACEFCTRPYELLSIGPVTLLFTCLHLDDDADPVSCNKSVIDLLDRHDSVHDPPLGNVIALKHATAPRKDPTTGGPDRADLHTIRLVQIQPGDVDAIDEMVVAACFALRHIKQDWTYFVPSSIAETTFNADGSRHYPSDSLSPGGGWCTVV
ncbi:hypothetical protein C8F01DRAFT_1331353 [Mycena amicta]|nr:hypothetical protein C8F01DRAFT_1331353 [Mycena amicta]